MNINFQLSGEDSLAIDAITRRAGDLNPMTDRLALAMDLTVVHNHIVKLDLWGLAASDLCDFAHDLNGIMVHLDRNTAKFDTVFEPRYARRVQ